MARQKNRLAIQCLQHLAKRARHALQSVASASRASREGMARQVGGNDSEILGQQGHDIAPAMRARTCSVEQQYGRAFAHLLHVPLKTCDSDKAAGALVGPVLAAAHPVERRSHAV